MKFLPREVLGSRRAIVFMVLLTTKIFSDMAEWYGLACLQHSKIVGITFLTLKQAAEDHNLCKSKENTLILRNLAVPVLRTQV